VPEDIAEGDTRPATQPPSHRPRSPTCATRPCRFLRTTSSRSAAANEIANDKLIIPCGFCGPMSIPDPPSITVSTQSSITRRRRFPASRSRVRRLAFGSHSRRGRSDLRISSSTSDHHCDFPTVRAALANARTSNVRRPVPAAGNITILFPFSVHTSASWACGSRSGSIPTSRNASQPSTARAPACAWCAIPRSSSSSFADSRTITMSFALTPVTAGTRPEDPATGRQ